MMAETNANERSVGMADRRQLAGIRVLRRDGTAVVVSRNPRARHRVKKASVRPTTYLNES